jgi:predicted TIM-barrel fold metal-dependent hydrolase
MTSPGATTAAAAIRSKLNHPIVDADGHAIEYTPTLFEFLKMAGGQTLVDRFRAQIEADRWGTATPAERMNKRITRRSTWSLPTRNTLDRATAMLPQLLRSRLDEFGIDYTIVYPSLALGMSLDPNEDLRRGACRALNLMFAELFRGHADRMTPVATIPATTPQEAIEELEYAVRTLGYKAVMVASNIRRPVPAVIERDPALAASAVWIDNLAVDSLYDYDPVWAKCVELEVAVTAHASALGWGSRNSLTKYSYNHIGNFAESGSAFAKALVMGGVTKRFPTLNFAFLEGGVAWASELYAGIVAHYTKRNASVVGNYDPRNIDFPQLAELIGQYGGGLNAAKPNPADPQFARYAGGWHWEGDASVAHEWDHLGLERPEDLRALFEPHFYFGCEADDPLVSVGFDPRLNPFGARLKAMFSSDLGHWDVPDMRDVLVEAYEQVERGLLDPAEFEEFTFTNPVMLHAGMNPEFFTGTIVEAAAKRALAG